MPVSQVLNPKGIIKKQTNNDLPFSPAQPVISSYYALSTSNQTVINLSFSVDTSNTDIFWLFVDGKKLDIGPSNDYTFTAVGADLTSSQVTLNQSLAANLNIQALKLGLKKESEFQTDNRFVQLYANLGVSFQGFVDTSSNLITPTAVTGTPAAGTFYSSISGRASITDLTQDLKSRFAINRLMTPDIQLVPTEKGSANQPVWSPLNDTSNRVRFIGGGWTSFGPSNGASANGSGVLSTVVGDSVEVTFYGTALNVLLFVSAAARTFNVLVDGASQPSISPTTASTSAVIEARAQNANVIFNVVSGLPLGVHTVTLSLSSGSDIDIYGFEEISQFSSGSNLVMVNPGTTYQKGQKAVTSAQKTFAYNSIVTGTTGGRVVVYQNSDGSIGSAFTQNASSPSYLGSANHANEEIVKTYHFREFGYGLSTDFSSVVASPAISAFATLDDGTTTLTATSAVSVTASNFDCLAQNAVSAAAIINFVGTGLDLLVGGIGSVFDNYTVYVDGVSQSTTFTGSSTTKYVSIASGLPYGTHCVQLFRSAAGNTGVAIISYTVYQPKTPAIPSGAIQLASYNTFGSFTQSTSSSASQAQAGATISAGTLRKMNTREANYSGTWAIAASSAQPSGVTISSSTAGAFVTYTFFGTGLVYLFGNNAAAQSFTVSIDGATNLSGFTTNLNAQAGLTFTNTTGVVTGTPATSGFNSLAITGLSLGIHTIKVAYTSGAAIFPDCFDIITPIHALKFSSVANYNNQLMIGSQGVSDDRPTSMFKDALPATKAWAQAFGIIAAPATSATTPVPMPDMNCSIKTNGGPIEVSYSIEATGAQAFTNFQIFVDGVGLGQVKYSEFSGASSGFGAPGYPVCDTLIIPVSAGVHSVQVYWYASSGTVTAVSNQRNLTVREL